MTIDDLIFLPAALNMTFEKKQWPSNFREMRVAAESIFERSIVEVLEVVSIGVERGGEKN